MAIASLVTHATLMFLPPTFQHLNDMGLSPLNLMTLFTSMMMIIIVIMIMIGILKCVIIWKLWYNGKSADTGIVETLKKKMYPKFPSGY